MKVFSPRLRVSCSGVWVLFFAALLLTSGCQQVFVPKHKVLVDAIAAPEATKPAGKSYRLVARRSMVSNTPVQMPILKACVDAALQGQGLFEPPPNVAPELIIEVSCGRDSSSRALAAVRETYLQLSARSNPGGAVDKATGPEIWDVRVAVLGLSGSIETALPLLSAMAAEHMGTNTANELRIEVPQSSPIIEAVRTAAISTLETQAQRVASANSPAPSAPAATREVLPSVSNASASDQPAANPGLLREPVKVEPEPEPTKTKAAAAPVPSGGAKAAPPAQP